MDLTPTSEQKDIADSVAEYLSAEVPIERMRLALDAGSLVNDALWKQWASMGFFSVAVPESQGGLSLGLVEEFLMFGEFGRHLAPGPILSSVLATHLSVEAGAKELTASLVDGAERVGLRVGGTGFDVTPGGLVLSLSAEAGVLERVRSAEPVPSIDPTVALTEVEVGEEVARVHGAELQTRQWILTAAVLLGLAQTAQRQSTGYARMRQQFGKPIGSFQAVKHRCADMLTRCYVAESQLRFAAVAVSAGHGDRRVQAAAALQLALDAARENTAINIQNHGGIGFTAEHDAGLYLKRAVCVQASLGAPEQWTSVLRAPALKEFE